MIREDRNDCCTDLEYLLFDTYKKSHSLRGWLNKFLYEFLF